MSTLGLRRTLATLLLCISGVASPAAAGDALYHYRPAEELPVLRSYHRQPYWRALAECAGIHGVMMDRFQAVGQVQAADVSRQYAVSMLHRANQRLQADRGLTDKEALALTAPMVEAGRGSGEALLGADRSGRPHSPEQIAVGMCGQLADRDAQLSRTSR
jgi:hypothetical protein